MRIKRSTLDLWKKRLMVFLASLGLFSLLYIYLGTSFFTVTTYDFVGVPDVYKNILTVKLSAVSDQKFLKVIKGDKVLSYHSSKIKETVVNTLPNTSQVTVFPVGLHTIRVKVTSYEPFFRIDDAHAITKEAVVYSEFRDTSRLVTVTLASSSLKTETVNDGITSTTIVGVTPSLLLNLSTLITKINSVIFVVTRVDINAFGDISLYNENGKSKIMFSDQQDSNKVWSNLLSAVDTDPLKSKLMNKKNDLEYLDARFGNKVFYKFTNDAKTAIIQSHATTTIATSTASH